MKRATRQYFLPYVAAGVLFVQFVASLCSNQQYLLNSSDGMSSSVESQLPNTFYLIAKEEGTDKVIDHEYGHLYDSLLRRFRAKPTVKLLEIGLGCGMSYGPGRSANVWQRYFPQGDIWFAEYNRPCADKWLAQTTLARKPQIVYGDQADPQTLERWMQQTDALQRPFDVIIDDGGHTWRQKTNSFRGLWAALAPGGLYFLEDLQTDFLRQYIDDVPENRPVSWIVKLLEDMWIRENSGFERFTTPYRLAGLKAIHCQQAMCVFEKCAQEDDGIRGQACE